MQEPALGGLAGAYSHSAVVGLARRELERARQAIREGGAAPATGQLAATVMARAEAEWAAWPRPLINATGVVIHTNLGRAPLGAAAIAAATGAARGYSDLEFDLESGGRGSRQAHVSRLLSEVTGADAGLVVNNNAAAVLLALTALAAGREVIVSRGEAVEIGGGFRIPDVLRQSGATLVEVGTTNRTYVRDYEAAFTPETAAILKVHPSNFRVTGFVHEATVAELGELAAERGLPLLHDLGSGCLVDTTVYGLAAEPTVQESLRAGAALALFSGDKLIGGPQAGIAVGGREWVDRMAAHPLARAVRIGKMGLAALSATLMAYLKDGPHDEVPVWRMIAAEPAELRARAGRWRAAAGEEGTRLRDGMSAVGGGSLPGETLPTTLLAVQPSEGPDAFAARLRSASTPVIARIEDDEVLLDPRTVPPEEDEIVMQALRAALGRPDGQE